MGNKITYLKNSHAVRAILLMVAVICAFVLLFSISDSILMVITAMALITIPMMYIVMRTNTYTRIDSSKRRVEIYFNLFGLKIPYHQIQFEQIEKTIVKTKKRSSYRYGNGIKSVHELYLKDRQRHRFLIYGPTSDHSDINEVHHQLADALDFTKSSEEKKIRSKTNFFS